MVNAHILKKFTTQFRFIKIRIQIGMVSIVDSIIQTLCKQNETWWIKIEICTKYCCSSKLTKRFRLTGDSVCSVSIEANEPAIVEMWSIVSFWLELSSFTLNFSNPDHIIRNDCFSYRFIINQEFLFSFMQYFLLFNHLYDFRQCNFVLPLIHCRNHQCSVYAMLSNVWL